MARAWLTLFMAMDAIPLLIGVVMWLAASPQTSRGWYLAGAVLTIAAAVVLALLAAFYLSLPAHQSM